MTTPGKGRIFISYRRTDSAGYAGRIYDRLTAHFGEDAVFMDVDTIEAGLDFVDVLKNAVQSCDVLVALIGRSWLNVKDEAGRRRLDNPEDFVRVEIAAALDRDIRVIPVLVDGVVMPRSTELPENLKPLARRNALQVDHHSFNADARRLISQLELALKAAEDSRILKARRLQEERERKEKEAREAGERKRVEKNEQIEYARLAAEQRAKIEREERERKEAKEKKRKDGLRKARQQKSIERIKNVFSDRKKLPFFIGGGLFILFLLGYIVKGTFTPNVPSSPTKTSTIPTLPTITLTENPSTPTLTVTETPTKIPVTPTPTLGVGSTMILKKDGMVMVYVPAGEFQMGSINGDSDEIPVHTIYLDAFWIDQTEVTGVMYSKCMAARECDKPKYTPGIDDHPVRWVSWINAKAYCKWADRRLPTEAEWEKAAGWDEESQAQRVYPWGNAFDCKRGNFDDETQMNVYVIPGGVNCDGFSFTAPVGSFSIGASFYGVLDMSGNVEEWVSSLYQPYPYSATDGREDLSVNGVRVVRGGAWDNNSANSVRTSSRDGFNSTYSYTSIGFRCARDAD